MKASARGFEDSTKDGNSLLKEKIVGYKYNDPDPAVKTDVQASGEFLPGEKETVAKITGIVKATYVPNNDFISSEIGDTKTFKPRYKMLFDAATTIVGKLEIDKFSESAIPSSITEFCKLPGCQGTSRRVGEESRVTNEISEPVDPKCDGGSFTIEQGTEQIQVKIKECKRNQKIIVDTTNEISLKDVGPSHEMPDSSTLEFRFNVNSYSQDLYSGCASWRDCRFIIDGKEEDSYVERYGGRTYYVCCAEKPSDEQKKQGVEFIVGKCRQSDGTCYSYQIKR